MDAQQNEIVKSLIQMAWADGEVAEAEKALLSSILMNLGCSTDEVDKLAEQWSGGGEPARLDEVLKDTESRHNAMRALLTMSFVDGALSFKEFTYIERVARQLEIGDDELEKLRIEAVKAADAASA